MNKISKRLQSITKFVNKSDELVDVGCDHGLLSIYLVINKLCKRVIASDINKNALQSAINNISKYNVDIPTVISDGIKDVNMKGINTLVISGMGTNTILHILEDSNRLKKVNKLIIQSNNDYELLRRELNNRGYLLVDEDVLIDKGKWYITMLFEKSNECNSEEVIKYGLLSNNEYNIYLLYEMNRIFKLIPWLSIKNKYKQFKLIKNYKVVLKKHH